MTIFLPLRLSMVVLALATGIVALTGCNNVSSTVQNVETPNITNAVMQPAIKKQIALSPAVQMVIGDYASEDYDKRAEGYDWVGVEVRPFNTAEIDIKVRARSDIKKPSCSFDGKATLMGQDNAHGIIFQTIANDSVTFLQFKDGVLTIDSDNKYALNYFCSGGGSLAGNYQKLTDDLELS